MLGRTRSALELWMATRRSSVTLDPCPTPLPSMQEPSLEMIKSAITVSGLILGAAVLAFGRAPFVLDELSDKRGRTTFVGAPEGAVYAAYPGGLWLERAR